MKVINFEVIEVNGDDPRRLTIERPLGGFPAAGSFVRTVKVESWEIEPVDKAEGKREAS